MTATDNSNSNDSATDYLNLFTAENLLATSPIMGQVLKLRDNISRNSDGVIVDYDDMLRRIQMEVDALPVLELQQDVPAGTEGAYQRQLLHALEKINDDHDRVLRKMLKLKSRLVNAITLMKIQRSQFAAFYNLAIPIAIHATNIPKLKLSSAHIKEMAAGEYSRLMDELDQAAPSLLSELEILEVEIKGRKASQAAKYALGKDQVNAMWNSFQSNGAIGLDDDPNALLKTMVDEEEDEVPSFVSRHTKEVRVGASIRPEPTGEIKGTFVKRGDPQPITSIVADEYCSPLLTEQQRLNLVAAANGPNEQSEDDELAFTLPERKDPVQYPVEITTGEWSKSRLLELEDEPVDEERADPDTCVTIEADVTWTEVDVPEVMHEATGIVIAPDAVGIAAINELARKANLETMAEIEATRLKKMKVLVAPPISAEELLNLRAHIDECKDDFSGEPLVVDYKVKWDDMEPSGTKSILIEDIQDSAPHTQQEAAQLMEDAVLGELDLPEFKPLTSKVLTGFKVLYVPPEKIVPADDFESIMNEPEPLAAPAPTTQRKRLAILEEDEL